MGLFFKGKAISEDEMLRKILRISDEELRLRDYSCELLEPTERLWIWTNPNTGRTVITGDEGNGWCVPLITANSPEEAIQKYLKNPPKAKFKSLFEALESLMYGVGKNRNNKG